MLWPLLAVAALAFLLLAGAALWWVLRDEDAPVAEEVAAAPTAAVVVPTAGPVVSPNQARVVVLAAPWGELTAIRRADGSELPLPQHRTTPVVLTLPAGRYELTLTHPGAPAPQSCSVELVTGQAATCQVQLVAVDVMHYFKEAGWWQ